MLPSAFHEKMARLLGPDYDAFLAAYDLPRAVGLRVNPAKAGETLPFALKPVPWAANGYYYDPAVRPGTHPWHDAGAYYLQEPSAMAPAALMPPKPGDRVLDLCAAPGGKSTQLAAALAGTGLLVCNEISGQRAKILSQNIERMGIANALVLNEHPENLAKRFPRYFDRVQVDAPCSGEGMFRKEEAAVQDWNPEAVQSCARRQREILESAAKMVRGGGLLVYSTCTFSPEENEGVISEFLHDHPEFSLPEVEAPWFAPGQPGWVTDPADGLEHAFRLWPHLLRGEGHFVAVLQYNGTEASDCAEEKGIPMPAELREFLGKLKISLPDGTLTAMGNRLYWMPPAMPQLRGLKVLRAGLCLGEQKKGRFEPDHALALYLKEAASMAEFPAESGEITAFLRGEPIPGTAQGWTLIRAEHLSLGWAKGSNGMLKNHYPKGLRRYRSV